MAEWENKGSSGRDGMKASKFHSKYSYLSMRKEAYMWECNLEVDDHLTISSGISGGVERSGSRVIMSLMYVEEVPLAK